MREWRYSSTVLDLSTGGRCQDISAGIATGYGLDGRNSIPGKDK
jgi:hypothetical protein